MDSTNRVTMAAAVFAGGAAGSLLRDALTASAFLPDLLTSTFTVNVLACLSIGLLAGWRDRLQVHAWHLGAIGFCGGLSTFSSFVADVHARIVAGDAAGMLFAPAIEIAIGILVAVVGEAITRRPTDSLDR